MTDRTRGLSGRTIGRVGVALALVVVTWGAVPAFVLNLAALYVRDLSIGLPEDPGAASLLRGARVPWGVSLLPIVRLSSRAEPAAVWTVARAARLLEYRGLESATLGCAWAPESCVTAGGRLRLSDAGHERLASAYVRGEVKARSPLEGELIAWSCLKASAQPGRGSLIEACRARLVREVPAVAAVLSPTGVVMVGHYVDELTEASSVRLRAGLESHAIDCTAGLDFLRGWVRRDGFLQAQLFAARSLSDVCSGNSEAQFYRARAADLADLDLEASDGYQRSGAERHPEAAFWQVDFLTRHRAIPSEPDDSPRADPVRVYRAEALLARYEDGAAMGPDTVVADPDAPDGRSRRAARFGAVLAYGPYVNLPYGRYKVTFLVKARGGSLTGRIAQLVVREDSDAWRPYMWHRILRDADADGSAYQRFEHEFTSSGEGTVSVAVVTLTDGPVFLDRVEVERVGPR